MKVKVSKQIGSSNVEFEVEEAKMIDALFTAGFLSSTPEKCSLCESKNVILTSNRAKGFTFVKVRCIDCGGQANIGQYKEGGLFWKRFEQFDESVKENKEE